VTATFLLDASAYWRLVQNEDLGAAWAAAIDDGELGMCEPTRTAILYSARSAEDRDQMSSDLDLMCERITVAKSAWQWVETAQYKLTLVGAHRSAGVVDLLVCATAAARGLTVLHDDRDYEAVARVLPDVGQHRITSVD
jgi:predicted nucleic acid-binding protein